MLHLTGTLSLQARPDVSFVVYRMHHHSNVDLHAGNTWVNAGNSLAFRDGPYAAGCNPPAVCPLPATVTEMPVALGAIALWINIPGMIRHFKPALFPVTVNLRCVIH